MNNSRVRVRVCSVSTSAVKNPFLNELCFVSQAPSSQRSQCCVELAVS